MGQVPALRVRACNAAAVRGDGEYVLYWMIAHRRLRFNFALQRAVEHALRLGRPLLVLEALRCDYPWASDRLHRFVLDGMAEHARSLASGPAAYLPYVEPEPGAGRGLLEFLAARACVVVTDDFPAFFLPAMTAAAAARVTVRLEAVDSNGLLPLRAPEAVFPTAFAFRRFLQRALPAHLEDMPVPEPLAGVALPGFGALRGAAEERWRPAAVGGLAAGAALTMSLPIDHGVAPVAGVIGGGAAARAALQRFLAERLARYESDRNRPDEAVGSGLSPYLHFGHLAAHEVFSALARHEGWSPERIADRAAGRRSGWWGMSGPAEAFLDQAVTWRELGFNFCSLRDDYGRFESLPRWALDTLAKHERDPRPWAYPLERLAAADTHDPLWNAAQRQLLREGVIHTYLRMLWGKKILEWSASPREAAAVMRELNDRYALDGRDPNSTTGIFWCLGRYDRPWGPERPIFGTVRYMSSENAARKLSVAGYLERYGR
ncbi:MAG: deoxyribodipyrimidine photolyase [Acidobacteriota bacterium]